MSSTNPEPVAPPAWPSYSAEICTVLGNSSWATAATDVSSALRGGADTVPVVVSPALDLPEPSRAVVSSLVWL